MKTLIHNAALLSFQEGLRKGGNALLIENNLIRAIGSYDELQPLVDGNTLQIDVDGRTIMPGLNDTHIHIWKVGNLKTYMLDLRGASSLEEMLDTIRDYDRKYPDLEWIVARGFNEAGWTNNRLPEKKDLDKIVPGKPVYVIRTCAHIAVANTAALQFAGVNAATKIPDGGVMHLGDDGEPNGILSETALGLVANHIPPYTKQQLKHMVLAARNEMYRYGITAATDPAVDPLLLEAYKEMNEAGELGFRLNAIPILLPDGGEEPYPLPELFESSFLRLNTVKFFSDGGLSGKTAALKRTYKNSTERGVLRLVAGQYRQLCKLALEKGLGIATHAIGDAAIEFVVDIYKEMHALFPNSIRRIEHLGLPEQKHLQEMAGNGISASMQTIFLSELGKNFIRYLDEDYLSRCYPVKSVLDHGILAALSSDAPVVNNFNPFKGVYAAVSRKDDQGNLIAGGEAISIREALQLYTGNAAKISGVKEFGKLEEGMLADFIELEKDPLSTPIDEIPELKVVNTWVDGKIAWSA
ncbi:amidohydrolase [Flavihumibacter profundi]|uniref:amidohydrolase n=1 Tax=Flavihumibacter profundi TaxID=2716883 RepID=UPI001CC6C358|nr:amidohydrolase [Flavihumibacter profundi]MBZ5858817.1 amidohydrolase [Flavihumibacter profundi]